jgi:predicted nucleotidyltransferase
MSWLTPKLEAFRGQGELYLYGSASRGEDVEGSDVDILVIGKERAIVERVRVIDGRIKASFFSPLEWAKVAREDPAFYERVEKDRIRLV